MDEEQSKEEVVREEFLSSESSEEEVREEFLSSLKKVLKDLGGPRGSRRVSLESVIGAMYGDIKRLQEAGWKLDEIVGLLKEGGVIIAIGTLQKNIRAEDVYHRKRKREYDLEVFEYYLQEMLGISVSLKELRQGMDAAKKICDREKLARKVARRFNRDLDSPENVVALMAPSQGPVTSNIQALSEPEKPVAQEVKREPVKGLEPQPPPKEAIGSKEVAEASPVPEPKVAGEGGIDTEDEPRNAAGIPLSFFTNPTVKRFNKIRRPGDPK